MDKQKEFNFLTYQEEMSKLFRLKAVLKSNLHKIETRIFDIFINNTIRNLDEYKEDIMCNSNLVYIRIRLGNGKFKNMFAIRRHEGGDVYYHYFVDNKVIRKTFKDTSFRYEIIDVFFSSRLDLSIYVKSLNDVCSGELVDIPDITENGKLKLHNFYFVGKESLIQMSSGSYIPFKIFSKFNPTILALKIQLNKS